MTQYLTKLYDGASWFTTAVDPLTLGAMLSQDLLLHLDFQRWLYDPITPEHRIIGSRLEQATITSAVHFVPGRSRHTRALKLETATTNLVTNPSFEVGVAGWSVSNVTLTKDTSSYVSGVASAKAIKTAASASASAYFDIALAGATAGRTFTFHAWVRPYALVDVGINPRLRIGEVGGATGAEYSSFASVVATSLDWMYLEITYTLLRDDRTTLRLIFYPDYAATTTTAMMDAVQCEEKNHATSYADGDRGYGYAWTGTPHASTSTRATATLTLDNYAGLLTNQNALSFRALVQVPAAQTGTWPGSGANNVVFNVRGADDNNRIFLAYDQADDRFEVYVNGAYRLEPTTQAFSKGDWLDIVVTLDFTNDSYKLYINGVLKDTDTTALTAPTLTTWRVGNAHTGSYQANVAFQEYQVWDRILTEAEILALYSLQRSFVDGQALENRPTVPGASAGYWRLPGSPTGTASASYSDVLGYDANKLTFAGAWATGQVQFECVFYTATGSVTSYAKLLVSYNAGANWYDVPGTALSQMTGTPTKMRTAPLALPQQECLYKVQIAGHATDAVYCTGWALVVSPGVTTL